MLLCTDSGVYAPVDGIHTENPPHNAPQIGSGAQLRRHRCICDGDTNLSRWGSVYRKLLLRLELPIDIK